MNYEQAIETLLCNLINRNEDMVQELLDDALIESAEDEDEFNELDGALSIAKVVTYERARMLTHNRGLVIRLSDGSEVQITIVQSRRRPIE
jgi:hypothetical protein